MAKKKIGISGIIYLIGIGGAIIVGLLQGLFATFEAPAIVATVFVVAGLLIGFLNITIKEAVPFMIATLMIGIGAGIFAILPFVGTVITAILTNIAAVSIPAGTVVGVMTIVSKSN